MTNNSLLGAEGDELGLGRLGNKLASTFRRRRLQASVVSVAVITSVAILSAGATAVSPTLEVEHQQTVFRGGGSDTTYEMMVVLDTMYNNSPGCRTVDTRIPSAQQGSRHLHNNVCHMEDLDEDLVSPQGAAATGNPPLGFDDDETPLQQSRRANYDHDVIMQYFPLGSSFGVRQLQRQEATITPAPTRDTGDTGTYGCGRWQPTSPAFGSGGPPAGGVVDKTCAPLDFARSSSTRSTGEIATGLRAYGFAREGLSWVCYAFDDPSSGCAGGTMNPDGIVGDPDGPGGLPNDDNRTLTHTQIRGIMSCDPNFNEWHEVGGAGSVGSPIPIRVYQAQGGSGTRTNWDAETGIAPTEGRAIGSNGTPAACAASIFENDARRISIEDNLDTPSIDENETGMAFFYFSSGRFTKPEANAGTVLNKIDGVAVSPTTIVGCVGTACNPDEAPGVERKPTFPYTRTVWNVIRDTDPQGNNASVELKEYLSEAGFLCKDSGKHTGNPRLNGLNYRTAIRNTMEKEGFAAVPLANTGTVAGTSHCRINSDPVIATPGL